MRNISYLLLGACICLASCNSQRSCGLTPNVVEQTYVHKYGVPIAPGDWAQRGESGAVITTLKNGVTVTRNYDNGILNGDSTYTFAHSRHIEKIETYQNGTLVKERINYRSGTPRQEMRHLATGAKGVTLWYENAVPQLIEDYDANGRLVKGEYFNTQNNLEAQVANGNGSRICRDAYGQIVAHESVNNGMSVERTRFHPNNTPKEIIALNNKGEINGLRKQYHPDGSPMSIESWMDGLQNGITTYYQNGEIYSEQPFRNGKRQGIEKRFNENGELVMEISWLEDQQHGPVISYIGGHEQTDWFFLGRPVSRIQYDLYTNPLPK